MKQSQKVKDILVSHVDLFSIDLKRYVASRTVSFALVPGSAWNANRKRLCLVMCRLQATRRREPPMPRIPGRAWNQNISQPDIIVIPSRLDYRTDRVVLAK